MGYLDNSTIVVDAVLTKEGRKRLAAGNGLGIEYFTLSDSGIDYRLWNPDHPSGSAFYGEAIENLPSLEAIPRAEFYMRNKLITLNQDVTGLPYWSIAEGNTIVLNDEPVNGGGREGTPVEFTFNQQPAGECYLIIDNQTLIQDVVADFGCQVGEGLATPSAGVSYQALVNQELADAVYYPITQITGTPSNFRLKIKRVDTTGTTNATIIDITTGLYKTFTLEVVPF